VHPCQNRFTTPEGETVEVQRMAPVPLSQLVAINPDQSTAEAIGDWHYWVAQGYCF
jgi:hypothetical protein